MYLYAFLYFVQVLHAALRCFPIHCQKYSLSTHTHIAGNFCFDDLFDLNSENAYKSLLNGNFKM